MATKVAFAIAMVVFVSACARDTSSYATGSYAGNGSMPCIEPENPYNDEGGHDAGYKWAEENGESCEGNSESFNEGCEEYNRQRSQYETCEAQKRK